MRCLNCKAISSEQQRFCSNCGSPLHRGASGAADGPMAHERKEVTILFADLTGSIGFLENRDPEDSRRLLVTVVDLLIEAVRDSSGIVNQVMGDGIMAIFGAPVADEYHAVNACIAAVRIHEAVYRYGQNKGPSSNAPIRIRVGIHSGEVVVGERGDGFDAQYAAFGEATHVAARLERMARPGATLISANTHALVRGQVLVEPKGPTKVRGLSRTIEVFELRGVRVSRHRRRPSLGQTILIGRTQELSMLRSRLQQVSAGSGQVVILQGEPGVGKSTLAAECAAEGAQNGWLVLESGAAPHLRRIPYFPIRDALQTYFVLNDDDDVAIRQKSILRRLRQLGSPELVEAAILGLFGLSSPAWEQMSSATRKLHIIEAIVWLTLTEGRHQPVVWVLEDLQWTDAETQAVIIALVAAIQTSRVLILLSHRSDYHLAFPDAEHSTGLQVSRLADEALNLLFDGILGFDPSLAQLKVLLAKRTGGNPFFIEECVRTLLESEALIGRPGQYRWVGRSEDFMPTSVQSMLAARIDRLAPEDKHLLQAAALIGDKVDPQVLQHLIGWPAEDLAKRLAELCASGFLTRTIQFSGPAYAFVHALSHDVAYRSLLQETRRCLHSRVVEILESLNGERVIDQAEILANHAMSGQKWSKAVQYFRLAARKALSQSACELAVVHIEEALKALAQLPDSHCRKQIAHDLRLELRNALFPLARHSEMLAYLLEAEDVAKELSDVPRQARSATHLCHCYWLIGEWSNAVSAGSRAIGLAEQTHDIALQVWPHFYKALAHFSLGELDDATNLLAANAVALTGSLQANRFGGFSLPFVVGGDWLGWCLAEKGEFAAALHFAEAGLKVAETVGYPFDLVHGRLGVAGVHLLQGNISQAAPRLERALDACDLGRVVSVRPRVTALLAYARALNGRISEALEMAEQAAIDAGRHGALRMVCLRWFAEVLLLSDQTGEALDAAIRVLDAARQSRQIGLEAWTLRLIGEAQCGQAAFDAAQDSVGRALNLAKRLNMRPLAAHCHRALAAIARGRGRDTEAALAAGRAQALYLALDMKGQGVE